MSGVFESRGKGDRQVIVQHPLDGTPTRRDPVRILWTPARGERQTLGQLWTLGAGEYETWTSFRPGHFVVASCLPDALDALVEECQDYAEEVRRVVRIDNGTATLDDWVAELRDRRSHLTHCERTLQYHLDESKRVGDTALGAHHDGMADWWSVGVCEAEREVEEAVAMVAKKMTAGGEQ